ncbi:plexin-B1 isoform X2 [Notamacropus eugenii]|uniref:plexin-B1 isoform X2 n=1 Tax=Notamacropus eugenii TaxID=9315 RepID=UPI003B6765E2
MGGRSFPPLGLRVTAVASPDPPPGAGVGEARAALGLGSAQLSAAPRSATRLGAAPRSRGFERGATVCGETVCGATVGAPPSLPVPAAGPECPGDLIHTGHAAVCLLCLLYQVTMLILGSALLQLLWAVCAPASAMQQSTLASFTPNNTRLQHLVRDSISGTLYLGATNFLFQLDSELTLEATVSTGPVLDSRDCLPPVLPLECPQAQLTDNPNQLLLVSPGGPGGDKGALVVCGSAHQGVCEQRRLDHIGQLLLRPERPGDTQYVAANDPAISTVGLVEQGPTGEPLLFVGRGYTSRGVGGGIPPITTRALRPPDPQAAFSYEETAKLAVGRLSEYSHHFVTAFARRTSVYFLFLRRDLQAQSRAFRPYLSRVCLSDQHYYSYVELPLSCGGAPYGLVQAAAVAVPGMGSQGDGGEVLFAAFSSVNPSTAGRAPTAGVSGASALCAFPLDEVDQLANRTRDACYTRDGRAEDGTEIAYIEYDVNSNCAQLPVDTLDAYPCGSDHTPSPMASRVPLEATPLVEWADVQLTAVAVSVENGHTIAFLGDSQGQLHKVYLGPESDHRPYATQLIQSDSAVSSDLIFDGTLEHLYVMTQSTVVRVPVASCSQHLNCTSCLAPKDPYCGWCVLLGRCSRRAECSRGRDPEPWLWSFSPESRCLQIQAIFLSISDLPVLQPDELYSCHFEEYESPAVRTDTGVMCSSPDPSRTPALRMDADHVLVPLLLKFGEVVIASTEFSFYDCAAVAVLYLSTPCQACVQSAWGCSWCVWQHLCTHKTACEAGPIVHSQRLPLSASWPLLSSVAPTGDVHAFTPSVPPKAPVTPVPKLPPTEPGTLLVESTSPSTDPIPLPTEQAPRTPLPEPGPPLTVPLLPTTAPPTTEAFASIPSTIGSEVTLGPALETAPTEEPSSLPSIPVDPGTMEGVGDTVTIVDAPGAVTRLEDLLPPAPSPSPLGEQPSDTTVLTSSSWDLGTLTLSSSPPWGYAPSTGPSTTFPGVAGSKEHAPDWLPREDELPEADEWTGSDASPFSTSTLLSGDGDSSEFEGPNAPHILLPDLDYQYDSPGLWELEEIVNHGPAACPCVEGIEGSSLLPVQIEHELTLLGRNFHLYQDGLGDYECVLELEDHMEVTQARMECDGVTGTLCRIICQLHQLSYAALQPEFLVPVFLRKSGKLRMDSTEGLHVTLYDCSVGRPDCSLCRTADPRYGCVWCDGHHPHCAAREACTEAEAALCPAPLIHMVEPLTGPVDGGTRITIRGSNLGQKHQDIAETVTVAGVPCAVDAQEYEVSSSIVCVTGGSGEEKVGHVTVEVPGGGHGISDHKFAYQDPEVKSIFPIRGPKAGGTYLTLQGAKLLTGRLEDIRVLVGDHPCQLFSMAQMEQLQCQTSPSPVSAELQVAVWFGGVERQLQQGLFQYTPDPNITSAGPAKSFVSGGRVIWVHGQNLDVVQTPRIRVTVSTQEQHQRQRRGLGRRRRIIPETETECSQNTPCSTQYFEEPCHINSSQLLVCRTPAIPGLPGGTWVQLEFILDNLLFDFATLHPTRFSYEANPILRPLNMEDPSSPFRHKPGSVLSVEGENLDLAISKDEVVAMIGDGPCLVKTLTRNHLYCEPPAEQPPPRHREGLNSLPEFTVQMGNLNFTLGRVQYDIESPLAFPVGAQVGLGVGASLLALGVLIIVFIYRRKSKQALRDYKKVQIQLENLETSVRDRCKKEFTDLMTEMTDLTSDLVGSGIPFLDYKSYAERVFFPGHRESPLHRDLGVPESRRPTVEQGLGQLSNLLNSKLFLTKFIHTLESQRTFSPRDRAYVASLLTVALHGKLEYFTDILRTLLSDLVTQYVAKNPKLMLRRTETVVEKLLTNWMSICLYTFVRDSVGEPLYMLFRGIKHQVDKGPVDSVTGKAKYTLNDNRLLREDLEYRPLTLNAVTVPGVGLAEAPGIPVKVLDCDTISQAKEKILDQLYKGVPLAQRPEPGALDVEWRSGVAGHLILSDEDVTSVVQGAWRRLNTLQHYKVPDGATVALVPRFNKHIPRENQDYVPGEKTPMLEDMDEGGIRPWHLVKPSEEPEPPRQRRGSLRGGDRERAKAIPEIYLTRLLSMKGTLQTFVDDLFQVILSTSRPVPLAIKYFFDLLDDQAQLHGISDQDTIHIWKTNSLPLRFWINIIKNPQFVFDVQTSDNMDAVLLVIAQTFMDACTLADHKLGRDSPINKLLYARDIPRYKQMVERYYADIRQTISASDQEMNSALAELSRNYSGDLSALVALHELYKYINKYYDQIITALEEDGTAQKMQLGYRLQQIAAAVENKVTDL